MEAVNLIPAPPATDSLLDGPEWDALVEAVVAEAELGEQVDEALAA